MVVKLKPTWKIPTKPANDKAGWEVGAKGIDGAYDADGLDFIGTWDRNADAMIYGPQAVGRREGDLVNPATPGSKRRR